MNNFPAMTEEQRQQAIKDFTFRAVNTDCDVSLLAYQIALASLTAEPDHYVFHHPAGKLLNYLASDECKGQDHIVAGYTAPPAPALRVPGGWIKCSERYPEVGQEVLIRIPVCEKFNIENGKYEGDGHFLGAWFDTRGKGRPYKVTHWMPLPPPPETSNEQ